MILNNNPARQCYYNDVAGSNIFTKMFCTMRWIEDGVQIFGIINIKDI